MENKIKKPITAKVIKTSMNKSAVVSVERLVKHPVNGKYIKRSTKYHIHDEDNKCSIYEDRPLACREYPHTNRKNMYQVFDLTLRNAEICPAVVSILDKIIIKYK